MGKPGRGKSPARSHRLVGFDPKNGQLERDRENLWPMFAWSKASDVLV